MRRSRSSCKVEADERPSFSSRKHGLIALASVEAEYHAGCAVVDEATLIRSVLVFARVQVKLRKLMDATAAHGICKRDGATRVRHSSYTTRVA